MLERFNRISDAKIVCPNCSHENPAPYRFCGMCGNALPRLTAGVPGETSAPASRTAESPAPRVVPPSPEREPARGQPISGPSFLGLNIPTDRSADYLLDEEEEPSGHWRIYAALAIVAVFAILLGVQWRNGKLNRAKVETSQAIRKVPFLLGKWKGFAKEIERAVDELSHLDRELKKTEARGGLNAQTRMIFNDPAFQEKFLAPSFIFSIVSTPEIFAERIRAESAKWGKIIRAAGVKAE